MDSLSSEGFGFNSQSLTAVRSRKDSVGKGYPERIHEEISSLIIIEIIMTLGLYLLPEFLMVALSMYVVTHNHLFVILVSIIHLTCHLVIVISTVLKLEKYKDFYKLIDTCKYVTLLKWKYGVIHLVLLLLDLYQLSMLIGYVAIVVAILFMLLTIVDLKLKGMASIVFLLQIVTALETNTVYHSITPHTLNPIVYTSKMSNCHYKVEPGQQCRKAPILYTGVHMTTIQSTYGSSLTCSSLKTSNINEFLFVVTGLDISVVVNTINQCHGVNIDSNNFNYFDVIVPITYGNSAAFINIFWIVLYELSFDPKYILENYSQLSAASRIGLTGDVSKYLDTEVTGIKSKLYPFNFISFENDIELVLNRFHQMGLLPCKVFDHQAKQLLYYGIKYNTRCKDSGLINSGDIVELDPPKYLFKEYEVGTFTSSVLTASYDRAEEIIAFKMLPITFYAFEVDDTRLVNLFSDFMTYSQGLVNSNIVTESDESIFYKIQQKFTSQVTRTLEYSSNYVSCEDYYGSKCFRFASTSKPTTPQEKVKRYGEVITLVIRIFNGEVDPQVLYKRLSESLTPEDLKNYRRAIVNVLRGRIPWIRMILILVMLVILFLTRAYNQQNMLKLSTWIISLTVVACYLAFSGEGYLSGIYLLMDVMLLLSCFAFPTKLYMTLSIHLAMIVLTMIGYIVIRLGGESSILIVAPIILGIFSIIIYSSLIISNKGETRILIVGYLARALISIGEFSSVLSLYISTYQGVGQVWYKGLQLLIMPFTVSEGYYLKDYLNNIQYILNTMNYSNKNILLGICVMVVLVLPHVPLWWMSLIRLKYRYNSMSMIMEASKIYLASFWVRWWFSLTTIFFTIFNPTENNLTSLVCSVVELLFSFLLFRNQPLQLLIVEIMLSLVCSLLGILPNVFSVYSRYVLVKHDINVNDTLQDQYYKLQRMASKINKARFIKVLKPREFTYKVAVPMFTENEVKEIKNEIDTRYVKIVVSSSSYGSGTIIKNDSSGSLVATVKHVAEECKTNDISMVSSGNAFKVKCKQKVLVAESRDLKNDGIVLLVCDEIQDIGNIQEISIHEPQEGELCFMRNAVGEGTLSLCGPRLKGVDQLLATSIDRGDSGTGIYVYSDKKTKLIGHVAAGTYGTSEYNRYLAPNRAYYSQFFQKTSILQQSSIISLTELEKDEYHTKAVKKKVAKSLEQAKKDFNLTMEANEEKSELLVDDLLKITGSITTAMQTGRYNDDFVKYFLDSYEFKTAMQDQNLSKGTMNVIVSSVQLRSKKDYLGDVDHDLVLKILRALKVAFEKYGKDLRSKRQAKRAFRGRSRRGGGRYQNRNQGYQDRNYGYGYQGYNSYDQGYYYDPNYNQQPQYQDIYSQNDNNRSDNGKKSNLNPNAPEFRAN